MRSKKILSVFLALVFVMGVIVPAAVTPVSAAWADKVDEDGNPIINYYTQSYSSDADKLSDMTLKYTAQDGSSIYVEEFTGEIAYRDAAGNTLFSNPYDVATGAKSSSTKQSLLSQIIITYGETTKNDKTMNSYADAAVRGQIKTKNIKNGIRMEYTIGEVQVTRLVPRRIPKDRFETLILDKITNDFHKERLASFYQLYDRSDTTKTETMIKEMEAKFPITKRMAIYVCSDEINSTELKQLESIIKTYCPLYTYDEMEQDHSDTDYTGVEVAPPCFRMSLEYTLEDGRLSVRMPANGIRFDESNYSLGRVSILPYMGAGNTNGEGYTFVPDGSGAIIRYEDVRGVNSTIYGKVYGEDFAYHSETNQNDVRYPVFGNVVTSTPSKAESTTSSGRNNTTSQTTETAGSRGYVAIITEGDSLAEIIAENGGPLHDYSTVYARFTPRPSDKYRLSSSSGDTNEVLKTSSRKYTGSYVIKYTILSDDTSNNGTSGYECSYVGMAKAYRDYLTEIGTLTKLTAEDTSADTPLYIETFGSLKTSDTFLSFPVTVDTPLTTFEDIETMYDELAEGGCSNIKFKLSGYTNGGLDSTYPTKISWVSALGGKSGFADLLSYSAEKGFGVYPDFDFAYVASTAYLDGISEKNDTVKTIDSRYAQRKYYDSATQSLESDNSFIVSPGKFEKFGEKFSESYSKYNTSSLSVSTLGDALNSDFNKKNPYNREDSKDFTVELLSTLSENFGDIMVDGGNSYSLAYADHVLGAPIDSSNYMNASATVPFTGIVLHGYTNYTGDAVNMEGDIASTILKTIENGASLYFTLSYQNINDLKESSTYNKYFSVDYANWKDEVMSRYEQVNDALKDLQNETIEEHEFISAYKQPTETERKADEAELEAAKKKAEEDAAKKAAEEEQRRRLAERKGERYVPSTTTNTTSYELNVKTSPTGEEFIINSKYQTAEGTVVRTEYSNGEGFLINYNSSAVYVKYDGQEYYIDALDFVKLG